MKITPSAVLGRTYGALTVLSRADNTSDGRAQWLCRCTCGAEVVVPNSRLRRRGTAPVCSKQHAARLLLGKRFGRLVVAELCTRRRASPGVVVRAVCDCGGVWTGRAVDLRRGHVKSCGCLPCGTKPSADRTGVMYKYVRKNYMGDAKARGLSWGLSDAVFVGLVSGACHYCGEAPSTKFDDKFDSQLYYNGIDRVDPTLGYVPSNTVSCCKRCNYAKHILSKAEFIEHVCKIYRHSIGGVDE